MIEAQGGEERAKYGDGLIKEYSKKLTDELNKNYNITTLKRMRQFYLLIQKGATLWHQLTWSHYRELLKLNNVNEVNYYIEITKGQNLSVRELILKIKNKEYERLDDNTKNKLINKEDTTVTDFVKNPIIIKSNGKEIINEKILKLLILENLDDFLKELGPSFCYIGNEYKIKNEFINNEVYKKVKDYSKNRNDLETYYNVGKLLIEAQGGEERAKYGDGLIKEYSKKLKIELRKGYSEMNLKNMRRFYLLQKRQILSVQLSWSHYVELLKFEDINAINYYIKITIE